MKYILFALGLTSCAPHTVSVQVEDEVRLYRSVHWTVKDRRPVNLILGYGWEFGPEEEIDESP